MALDPARVPFYEDIRSADRDTFERAQQEMLELARETRDHDNGVLMLSRIINALIAAKPRPELDPDVEQEIVDVMIHVMVKYEGRTHLGYTNKVLYEIYNSMGGAQLLGERVTEARAVKRFRSWINVASLSLATQEYLSPMYASTTNNALRAFVEEQENEEVRFKAQIMLERWWLHIAMHFHFGLREVAGPYSRCAYQPSICAGNLGLRLEQAYGWQTLYRERQNEERKGEREMPYMPDYIDDLLTKKDLPCCFRETYQVGLREERQHPQSDMYKWFCDHETAPGVFRVWGEDQAMRTHYEPHDWGTTYLGRGLTLGSRAHRREDYNESPAQSPINIIAHMLNEKALCPNHAVYCRYWNEAGETVGRGSVFRCHQERNIAVVSHHIDTVLGESADIESGRLMQFWAWEDLDQIDGLWVDGVAISEFPAEVGMEAVIMIHDGSGWVGLRPLLLRGVSGVTPRIELVRCPLGDGLRGGNYRYPDGVEEPTDATALQLRLIHYDGPARRFTVEEMAPALAMSAVEVHETDAFADADAFLAHLHSAVIDHEGDVHSYTSDGLTVGLNETADRKKGAPATCPQDQIDSPYVCANNTGVVELGDARVTASVAAPLTLVHPPASTDYVILHIANQPPADLTFSLGGRSLEIPDAGFGRFTVHTGGAEWRVERFEWGAERGD